MRYLAFLFLCGGAAFGQPEEMAYRRAVLQAEQSLERGEPQQTIADLASWAVTDPPRADAQRLLGLAYHAQQNYLAAARHLSTALPLETPDSQEWRQTIETLGQAYYFANRTRDAAVLLEKALSWKSGDQNLLYLLAMAYAHAHDTAGARQGFARLFQIDPDSPQAYLLAAELVTQEGYEEDAAILLGQARKIRADIPEAAFGLGLVAFKKGDYAGAVTLLREELSRNPAHWQAWYYLGESQLALGRQDQALETLQRAALLNPRFIRSYLAMGKIWMDQGRLPLAENTLRRAVQVDPQNYEAHFLLARLYHRTNRVALARQEMAVAERLRAANGESP